jgi:hypothetical protein
MIPNKGTSRTSWPRAGCRRARRPKFSWLYKKYINAKNFLIEKIYLPRAGVREEDEAGAVVVPLQQHHPHARPVVPKELLKDILIYIIFD